MGAVPADYLPQLLPAHVRGSSTRATTRADRGRARRFGADPELVVSIMREESRFDPRARSAAAARGLLQIVLTTARDVGRTVGMIDLAPEDLYDPSASSPSAPGTWPTSSASSRGTCCRRPPPTTRAPAR